LGQALERWLYFLLWDGKSKKRRCLKRNQRNYWIVLSQRKKNKRNKKILALLQQQEQITNNDVEKLLGVADSTATNYLDELEQADLITQKGKTGRNVFYILK